MRLARAFDQALAKDEAYGWIDKDNGIVHIPIDKAIELTLERSLVHSQAAGEPIQSNPEN